MSQLASLNLNSHAPALCGSPCAPSDCGCSDVVRVAHSQIVAGVCLSKEAASYFSDAFKTPIILASASAAFLQAKISDDNEAMLDAKLRLAGTPFSLLSNGLYFFNTVVRIIAFVQYSVASIFVKPFAILSPFMAGFGIVAAAIETFNESLQLRRVFSLLDKFNFDFSQTGEEGKKLILENLEGIYNYYLNISADEERHIAELCAQCDPKKRGALILEIEKTLLGIKQQKLMRRVGDECAKELIQELPELISNIRNAKTDEALEAALEEGRKTLSNIKTQCQKKLLIHFAGLILNLLYLAGFICTLISCPPLLVSLLFGLGTVFLVTKYLAEKGLLNEKGWHFSKEKCIPQWVKDLYHRCFSNSLEEGSCKRECS
jgi:hypothetical protein